MTEEIGLAQPVEYAEAERRTIATHEVGSRHGGMAGGQGPQDGGPLHREAQGRPRAPVALRGGGALHQDPYRDRGPHPDRLRGHGGRGDLLRGDELGVASDLQAATVAACQMVGSLGMGSTLISAAALDMPGNIVTKVTAVDSGREEVEQLLRAPRTTSARCSRTIAM